MPDFDPSLPSMSFRQVLNYVSEDYSDMLGLPDIHNHPYDTSITPETSDELPDYGEEILDARWLHFRDAIGAMGRTTLRATLDLHIPSVENAVIARMATAVTRPDVSGGYYSKLLTWVPLAPLLGPAASTPEGYARFRNTASILGIKRIIADIEASKEYPEYSCVSRVFAVERPLDRRVTKLQPGQSGTIEGIIQEHHRPVRTYYEKSDLPTLEIAPRGQRETAPRERIALTHQLPAATSSHQTLFKPIDLETLGPGDLVQVRAYEHEGGLSTALHPNLIVGDMRNGILPSMHLVTPVKSEQDGRWEASLARAADFHNHLEAIRSAADSGQFREAVGAFLQSRVNMEAGNVKITDEEFASFAEACTSNLHEDDIALGLLIEPDDSANAIDAIAVKSTYGKNLFAMNKQDLAQLARNIISGNVQPGPDAGPHAAYLPLIIKRKAPGFAADIYEKTLTVMLPRLLERPGFVKMSSHDRSFVGLAFSYAYLHPDQRLMANTILRASYALFNPELAAPDRHIWKSALEGIQKIITHSIESKDGYIRTSLSNFTEDNIASVIKPEAIDTLAPLLLPLLTQADKMIDALAAPYTKELAFLGDTIRKDMHQQTAQIRQTFAIVARKRTQITQ